MSTSFDPPRRPAGDSTGGQFAAFRQSDQLGTLEVNSDEWFDADAETALAAVFDEDFMDDLQSAVDIASTLYPRYADDLLGQTYEAVHTQVVNAHTNRRPVKLGSKNRVSYLAQVAKAQGNFEATGLDWGPDIAGFRAFTDRRRALENARGRTLTGPERDALADEVRASFPPKRRPGPAFYRAVGELGVVSDDGKYLGRFSGTGQGNISNSNNAIAQQTSEQLLVAESGGGWSDGLRANPVMEEMVRIQKAGLEHKRGTAERMVYTLAASEHGAPLPVEGSVSERTARRHKETLRQAGGVDAAVRQYENGQATPRVESALFAPVTPPGGSLSRREKRAACRALTHFDGRADKTYNALVNTVLQHEADTQRTIAAR